MTGSYPSLPFRKAKKEHEKTREREREREIKVGPYTLKLI
jgi:hypothetical protein